MNIAFRRRPSEASSCCGSAATGSLSHVLNDPFLNEVFGALGAAPAALPLDVVESESAFVVRADVPGFKKDQIALDLEKGVLTVRAEAVAPQEGQKDENAERYHRRERRSQTVSRRIALPEGVLESQIAADLSDGVLTITLPKAPQAQPRKIEIK